MLATVPFRERERGRSAKREAAADPFVVLRLPRDIAATMKRFLMRRG